MCPLRGTLRVLKPYTLIALHVGQAPWNTGSDLPTELLVCPWGEHEGTTQGSVVVNDKTAAVLAANQRRYGHDRVALDFEHGSFFSQDKKGGDPVKVAAFGTPVCHPGRGIVLENLAWTPQGAEHWSGGHYPDLSPVIARDPDGTVVFLQSAALCRQGDLPTLSAFSFPDLHITETTNTKPTNTKMDTKLLLITLMAALGVTVPEDASAEQLAAAATEAAEKAKSNEAPAPELSALSTRIAQLEQSAEKAQRSAIVARASAEGKVIPLDDAGLQSLPLAALSAMVDKLPATLPLTGLPAGLTAHSARQLEGGMSEADKQVARQLGIDEATWKKHNA